MMPHYTDPGVRSSSINHRGSKAAVLIHISYDFKGAAFLLRRRGRGEVEAEVVGGLSVAGEGPTGGLGCPLLLPDKGPPRLLLQPGPGQVLPVPHRQVPRLHRLPRQHAPRPLHGQGLPRHLPPRRQELPRPLRHRQGREARRLHRHLHALHLLHRRLPRLLLPRPVRAQPRQDQERPLRPPQLTEAAVHPRLPRRLLVPARPRGVGDRVVQVVQLQQAQRLLRVRVPGQGLLRVLPLHRAGARRRGGQDHQVARAAARAHHHPRRDHPQVHRGPPHPHLPRPFLPRQVQLRRPLLLRQLRRRTRPRRPGQAVRTVEGRGLPQPRLRHLLQLLRGDEGAVPGARPADRRGRSQAPRPDGGGDPIRRQGRGGERHACGPGEDGADQVGGVRGAADRPAGGVPVREGEERSGGGEPRQRLPREERRDAVRVPAVRNQGQEGVRRRRGSVRAQQVRGIEGEAAAQVRDVVQRAGDGEPHGGEQAVRREGLRGARGEAAGGGALPALRYFHGGGRDVPAWSRHQDHVGHQGHTLATYMFATRLACPRRDMRTQLYVFPFSCVLDLRSSVLPV